MSSFESFEEDEKTKEIKRLIESGKAFDVEDAEDMLFEESEANFFRELDGLSKDEYLKEIGKELEMLKEKSEELDKNSEEWRECDNKLYNLRFEKAVISIAENADEREFLYYSYWLDLPAAKSDDDDVNKRREVSRRRLEEKKNALSSKISDERLNKILSEYKTKLPELLLM